MTEETRHRCEDHAVVSASVRSGKNILSVSCPFPGCGAKVSYPSLSMCDFSGDDQTLILTFRLNEPPIPGFKRPNTICEECEGPIEPRQTNRGRRPRFCSQKCASKNWQRLHPRVSREQLAKLQAASQT